MFHIQSEQAAKAGIALSSTATVTSFVATALPVVQFVAACIGVLVGLATLVYYIKRIRKE